MGEVTEHMSLKELIAECNKPLGRPKLYRGPLWRDRGYWNMRLELVWLDTYGTLEEYLDGRDALNLYIKMKDPTIKEIR